MKVELHESVDNVDLVLRAETLEDMRALERFQQAGLKNYEYLCQQAPDPVIGRFFCKKVKSKRIKP